MPRGFSLLELLLSMALGLLLCALFLPVLQATLHSQRFALGQLDAQQEARFVLQQLGWDLRMAGSFGCAGPAQWSAAYGPALPQVGATTLGLVYADAGVAVRVETDPTGQPGLRLLQTPPPWAAGQVLLLSSCHHVDRLILGEQAWLQAQEDTVWLRLAHDSPAWQNLNRHHLLSLELQPLRQHRYHWDAQGALWLQQDGGMAQLLAIGMAGLQLQAMPLTSCLAGQRAWWWTVRLAMQETSAQRISPAYEMQLASRMGAACPAQ